MAVLFGIVSAVLLKGNVALLLHSMLDPRELDTLYSRCNTHIVSKHRVVNHLRLFEYYPLFLTQV